MLFKLEVCLLAAEDCSLRSKTTSELKVFLFSIVFACVIRLLNESSKPETEAERTKTGGPGVCVFGLGMSVVK